MQKLRQCTKLFGRMTLPVQATVLQSVALATSWLLAYSEYLLVAHCYCCLHKSKAVRQSPSPAV